MSLLSQFLDLLFPPRCPWCGALSRGTCSACAAALPYTAGKDVVRKEGSFRCAAPLWYEGPVREGVLRLKFQGHTASVETFGALMAQCAAEEFPGEFDTVTWAPVSQKRLRSRGFDQSKLLSQATCRHWGTVPVELLQKTTHTAAQSSLKDGFSARQANVLGVYAPVPGAEIQGKRILLIDDICTTGATLKECRRTLLDAGAKSVLCLCLAHARKAH